MKNIYSLFFILIVLSGGCKTAKTLTKGRTETETKPAVTSDAATAEINFHDQTLWILGYFNPELLTHYPYSTWYLKGFDDYQVKTDALNKLLEISKENLSVKVVMGIWCPDSRREVPRFMKVMDLWHFPAAKVTFIGVDDTKQSPVGEYIKLDILRVPTFILYKNNIEAGRIIENPVTSLEQDMVNILTGMNNNK
ncbi:MAG: thioredoxin family protein [Bacteroidales bacterium]